MARAKIPSIDNLSMTDLQTLLNRVEAAISERQQSAKAELVESLKAQAEAAGFSFNDLMGKGSSGRKKRTDAGKKLEAKYRGPNGETYTGRGPTPKWLKELEAAGRKRERYLVK